MNRFLVFIRPLKECELALSTALQQGYSVAIVDQPDSDFIGIAQVRITVSSIRNEQEVYSRVIELSQRVQIAAVYSALDYLLPVVGRLNDALGLVGISAEQGKFLFHKQQQKMVLQEAGLPTAPFTATDAQDFNLADVHFPCIVKPTDRTGSRGVYKVDKRTELAKRLELTQQESWEHVAIIENFIPGEECSVEGYLYENEYVLIGITGKRKNAHNITISDSLYFPKLDTDTAGIVEIMRKLHQGLGLENVVTNVDLILSAEGLSIVEVNGRIGGGMIPEMILRATGCNLYAIQYDLFVQKRPSYSLSAGFAVQSLIRFTEGRITGFSIPTMDLYDEVRLLRTIGDIVHTPQHKNDAIGYVITIDQNREDCFTRNAAINDQLVITEHYAKTAQKEGQGEHTQNTTEEESSTHEEE